MFANYDNDNNNILFLFNALPFGHNEHFVISIVSFAPFPFDWLRYVAKHVQERTTLSIFHLVLVNSCEQHGKRVITFSDVNEMWGK